MSVRYIRYKPFPNQIEAQVLFGNILHNYRQTPKSSCPPSELLAENSEVSLVCPSNKSPAKTKRLKFGTSYHLRS